MTDDNQTADAAGVDVLTDAQSLSRLRWHCRRGMRELDVVMQRYLEQRYAEAPAAEQRAFEDLLELQDPQLLSFLLGHDVPERPDLINVIAQLTRVTAR